MTPFKLASGNDELLGTLWMRDRLAEGFLSGGQPYWKFAICHGQSLACVPSEFETAKSTAEIHTLIIGRWYGKIRGALFIMAGSLLDVEQHPDLFFTPSYALLIGNVLIPDGDRRK